MIPLNQPIVFLHKGIRWTGMATKECGDKLHIELSSPYRGDVRLRPDEMTLVSQENGREFR